MAALVGGSTGYWYPAENRYWNRRGEQAHWTQYMYRVTWTGVTGHWCDILIGLTIIPVGRHSVLGQIFNLHTSTLLFAHKLLAYSLFVGALIHGLIYYASLILIYRDFPLPDISVQFLRGRVGDYGRFSDHVPFHT